jgi:hypothetical protein
VALSALLAVPLVASEPVRAVREAERGGSGAPDGTLGGLRRRERGEAPEAVRIH